MPFYQIFKFVRTPGRLRLKVKKARGLAAFGVAAIAIVCGILLIPTPLRIQGSMVLKLAKPEEIYAEVPGRLVELKVKDGDWVKEDTVLATLSNPEKQKELSQKQQDFNVSLYKGVAFSQSAELENRAQARQFKEFADNLEPAITKTVEEIGKLTLISHRSGQVVGSPHKETVGQWLRPGKPIVGEKLTFCEIGDPHQLEAHLILDQGDIHLIKPGCVAWVKVYGRAEITYKCHVGEISKRSREEVPTELSNMAQGEVASKPDRKTGRSQAAVARHHEVIIPIDNSNLNLQPGLRGTAKLDGGTYTLAWWLMRWWNKMFSFQL